jgi:hypothetical protein
VWILHNANMLNVHELKPQDFVGLSPGAAAELAAKVLQHIGQQSQHIALNNHIENLVRPWAMGRKHGSSPVVNWPANVLPL